MSDLAGQWDALKDAIPSDHAEAANLMWEHGDRMADRIEALEAQIAAADRLAEAANDMSAAFYSNGNVTDRHLKACTAGVVLDDALAAYRAARVQP